METFDNGDAVVGCMLLICMLVIILAVGITFYLVACRGLSPSAMLELVGYTWAG